MFNPTGNQINKSQNNNTLSCIKLANIFKVTTSQVEGGSEPGITKHCWSGINWSNPSKALVDVLEASVFILLDTETMSVSFWIFNFRKQS